MTGIHTPPWRVRLATTAAAWLVAFATVMALLTAIGHQLQTLPPALRALVISGVLVVLMANLFMPVIGALAHRWLAGNISLGTRTRSGAGRAGCRSVLHRTVHRHDLSTR